MRRLLIRPGAIGDCIAALPALEYLAAGYTEVWIPSVLLPLLPFADRVRPLASTGIDLLGVGDLPVPESLQAQLQSFDSIVSWYGANRPEFRDAVARLGVPCKFHPALPPTNYPGHAVDFFLAQVGAPLGRAPHINVHHVGPRRDTVVIHPFSGSPKKTWPASNFKALASQLNGPVEWTAGPEEEWSGATRFTNLAELAGWIANARLYIGNDSGVAHLAAAAGARTLVLFGPTSPRTWAPRGPDVTVLAADPIHRLTVATVLATANRLLGSP